MMATYKYASVSTATSGDNALVAAVTAKKIRVHSLVLVAAGAVTATLKSSTTAVGDEAAISGAMSLITGTPLVMPFNERGWCESAAGKILNMELGGNVQVSGVLVYSEV